MKKLPGRSILKVSRALFLFLRLPFCGSTLRLTSTLLSSILPQISRANIFESSFDAIMDLEPEALRKDLKFAFDGEDGLDYGGVSRSVRLLSPLLVSEIPSALADLFLRLF